MSTYIARAYSGVLYSNSVYVYIEYVYTVYTLVEIPYSGVTVYHSIDYSVLHRGLPWKNHRESGGKTVERVAKMNQNRPEFGLFTQFFHSIRVEYSVNFVPRWRG